MPQMNCSASLVRLQRRRRVFNGIGLVRLAFFLALVLPTFAASEEACRRPLDVAKALYASSYYFYSQGAKEGLLAPAFLKAVTAELECAKHEGECGINYDPWLGAQDGEISGTPRFSVISGDMVHWAVVQVSYRFVIADTSAPHTVELVLHRQPNGCWAVNDFITPIGDSLLYILNLPD